MAIDASRLDPIFKAYDIRGTVPDQLDAAIVEAVGSASAVFAKAEAASRRETADRILIGHDLRPSGPAFAAALATSVTAQGPRRRPPRPVLDRP